MKFSVKGATLPPVFQPHDGAFSHLHGQRYTTERGKQGTILSAYAGADGRVWAYVQLDIDGGVQNGRFPL